jgi:hypothetical protein
MTCKSKTLCSQVQEFPFASLLEFFGNMDHLLFHITTAAAIAFSRILSKQVFMSKAHWLLRTVHAVYMVYWLISPQMTGVLRILSLPEVPFIARVSSYATSALKPMIPLAYVNVQENNWQVA